MKTDNKELSRIRSFNEIRIYKVKLRSDLEYEEAIMSSGLTMLGESLKNSVMESLKELGRDVATTLISNLVLRIRKGKEYQQ
jgi:hypothetical protein